MVSHYHAEQRLPVLCTRHQKPQFLFSGSSYSKQINSKNLGSIVLCLMGVLVSLVQSTQKGFRRTVEGRFGRGGWRE